MQFKCNSSLRRCTRLTAGPDYQEAAADYINQHADFFYTTQYFQILIIWCVFCSFFVFLLV